MTTYDVLDAAHAEINAAYLLWDEGAITEERAAEIFRAIADEILSTVPWPYPRKEWVLAQELGG